MLGKIECKECGKEFSMITVKHLRKEHGMTIVEYREKHPDAEIQSEELKIRRKHLRSPIFENELKDDELIIEDDIKNTKPEVTEFSKMKNVFHEKNEDLIKKLEKTPTVKKTSVPVIEDFDINQSLKFDENYKPKFENEEYIDQNKLQILHYLISQFPDLHNNFFVVKTTLGGFIEYNLITDMVILYRKIDLEFPNAFWHNYDIPKDNRDQKLIKDGWKVINIESRNPTVEDVRSALSNANLI